MAPQAAAFFFAYKGQIAQELKPDHRSKRLDFATDNLLFTDMHNGFLPSTLFSDATMFHRSGKGSRHITHIWGSQNPHTYRSVVRDSPKANVWRSLMKDRNIGPFPLQAADLHNLSTGWDCPTLEIHTFETPHENFPRSFDLERRTVLLAPMSFGYHSSRQAAGCPCAWHSSVTTPQPECDCFSSPVHTGQNMANIWV
jgi:hypothetical protein